MPSLGLSSCVQGPHCIWYDPVPKPSVCGQAQPFSSGLAARVGSLCHSGFVLEMCISVLRRYLCKKYSSSAQPNSSHPSSSTSIICGANVANLPLHRCSHAADAFPAFDTFQAIDLTDHVGSDPHALSHSREKES